MRWLSEADVEAIGAADGGGGEDGGGDDDLGTKVWWMWIVVPVVSGLVGWGTNWLAIQMTFYPLEFWPLKGWQLEGSPFGLFGWQGIIPAKVRHMAGIMVDLMLDKLLDVKAVFGRVDPAELARLLGPGIAEAMPALLDGIAGEEGAPTADVWAALPTEVRAEVAREATAVAPDLIRSVFGEVQADVTSVLDIKAMVQRLAYEHKLRAVQLFQRCGTKEFPLIIHSGLAFGFLFGLVQALVAWFYNPWWVLPLFGFLVGYATNWVALFIIFNPVEPINVCGKRWQGVFLTRQEEVSAEFARTNAEFYLNASEIWPELLRGTKRPTSRRWWRARPASWPTSGWAEPRRCWWPTLDRTAGPRSPRRLRRAPCACWPSITRRRTNTWTARSTSRRRCARSCAFFQAATSSACCTRRSRRMRSS